MALDVETICTDADLQGRATQKRLNQAQPDLAMRDAARAQALREVVLALQGRSPPITESDLTDPTELRDVVCVRALQIIFEGAMSTPDSVHAALASRFGKEYDSFSKRSYTVSGGLRGPSGGSFRMERR